jgi:FkbM family methyltransferase
MLFLLRINKLVRVARFPRLIRALLRDRVLAGTEHRSVIAAELATVIDVGANRGQFSLAVQTWAPNARIIAFEPLAQPAACFRQVFTGNEKVTLHQAAIGPEDGEAVIHISKRDDSSSLFPIGVLQERLFPGTEEALTDTIRVSRLDQFVDGKEIKAPALLKLDIQGYELEALRGCQGLLRCFAYVYVECSFVELYSGQALAHDIIAWLYERGFKLTGVYNVYYGKDGRAVQGDFLFHPKV